MPLLLTRAHIPYDIAAKWEADGRPGFADPYAWHQRTWECFPDRPEAPRDFLTRVDPKDDGLQLIILSPSQPVRPSWCPEPGWQTKEIDEEVFFSRRRFRFSLLANPTRKVRSNVEGVLLKNSRRVPITHREDREDAGSQRQRGLVSWLAEHGEAGGFNIDRDSLQTVTRPRQNFVRPAKGGEKRHGGVIHAVDFHGLLEVADPTALRTCFLRGIGPAKAFGFGLLCLSPA